MDREKLQGLFDLSGRVVIVTGGTRGIGLALAEGYVAAGARVVVASRKADACKEVEDHLRSMGGEAIGVPAHMGSLGPCPCRRSRAPGRWPGCRTGRTRRPSIG